MENKQPIDLTEFVKNNHLEELEFILRFNKLLDITSTKLYYVNYYQNRSKIVLLRYYIEFTVNNEVYTLQVLIQNYSTYIFTIDLYKQLPENLYNNYDAFEDEFLGVDRWTYCYSDDIYDWVELCISNFKEYKLDEKIKNIIYNKNNKSNE